MQIGGYVLCAFTMDKLGRRLSLVIMMAVAGAGILISTVITLLAEKESGTIHFHFVVFTPHIQCNILV